MLKFDGSLWLSTGKHRGDMSWKNEKMQWSDLVALLQKPYQTKETLKDYQKFSKDRQAEIKDVGGFVGGPVTGGRRLKGKVGSRSLVTLDLDYAPAGFWAYFQLIYENAAFLHATHAHTPEKPRLRLIMPLSREVLADEYEAISRWIAGELGIDYFDDTTFQPERLMFWPSYPRDVTYYKELQDGKWIDPDQVLANYHNWKDSSQWPLSSRVREIPKRLKKIQGDPHEKPGLIGAFCRSYTIQEAIEEYLRDVYEATDDDNRYTYMQGSTAKGLVVYEDKYAYSHHGTDPISGHLCNSFDLVRLHLYGAQDEGKDPDTPVNELPSYKAMNAKAAKDKQVAAELAMARFDEASRIFDNVEEEDKEFLKELDREKKSGNLLSTIKNAYLICKHDPDLKGCFAHNSFMHADVALKDLPWRKIKASGEMLDDDDDACLRGFIEKNYGGISKEKINDGFRQLMVEKSFHPVREYLESLTWDGEHRIDSLLNTYFGAGESEYIKNVTRKCLVAAVARIFEPGIKYDTVLILVGPQGKGKSTFIGRLGGEWFSDTFGPLDNMTRASENLQGKWIIEIGELAAFKGKEHSTVKHFIASPKDWFRAAYARRNKECPRQCIFIGSTNKKEILNDVTGDRRFWPVLINPEKRQKDPRSQFGAGQVRQIWAEAVQLYKNGETIYLSDEVEIDTSADKDIFREADPRDAAITRYLNMPVPEDFYRLNDFEKKIYISDPTNWKGETIYKTTLSEIWQNVFQGKLKDETKYNTQFIRDYFEKSKEWEAAVFRSQKLLVRGFRRKNVTNAVTDWKDLL